MSHKWWHKWGSSPEDEAIQSGFAADDTGIFGVPQETDMLEGIKRNLVDVGLEKVGAPDIVDYDAATEVIDTFKEEGAGGAADTVINLVKSYGIEKGFQMALNTGIPVNTIMAVLNSEMLEPWTGPFMSDAGTMTSDIDDKFLRGYGKKFYNAINSPFNFFGGTSGIFGNRQNIVPVEEPAVQQPGVIDQYIASLNQPTVTQNDDGTQTISGGTSDPSDDITVTNLPPQVAGPSEDYGFDDSGGFIGEGWKKGGLASMTRVLRR